MAHETIAASEWSELARSLKDGGWLLTDLCGLDRLGLGSPRFEAVAQLLHRPSKRRMTVHVVAAGEPPLVPSVTSLWPTASFMEREAYDLVGIRFQGHPELTRILMPDEWEGHPLRKDYGVGKVPVEFLPQPVMQIDTEDQAPNPEESHVDIDALGQTSVGEGGRFR